MKNIIRQLSQDNRVAEEFKGSLNRYEFPLIKESMDEIGFWVLFEMKHNEGVEFSLQEVLNRNGFKDWDRSRFPYQDNAMTFIRSGSALLIKSEIFGDCSAEFTIKSIRDTMMYHDMCLRSSDRLQYVDFFIPLTKEERYELLDEQRRLLKESEKIVEENQRILKEMRFVQQMLYQ